MSDLKYDIIPIKKTIDKNNLVNDVIAYMYSRLKDCHIELNTNENTYTILISPISAKHKEQKRQLTFITIEMILQEDSCAISFISSKARPVLNVALAAVSAPIFLPGSAMFLGTAAYRLWYCKKIRKEVVKFISASVN